MRGAYGAAWPTRKAVPAGQPSRGVISVYRSRGDGGAGVK